MASENPKPWENETASQVSSQDPETKSILRENGPMLMDKLELSDKFMIWLKKLQVLSEDQLQEVEVERTPNNKISVLLRSLRIRPVINFHGFLKSLVESGQAPIVQTLGFNPAHYIDVLTPRPRADRSRSHFLCGHCLKPLDEAHILICCSVYLCKACSQNHKCDNQASLKQVDFPDHGFLRLSQLNTTLSKYRDCGDECGTCKGDGRPPYNHKCEKCDEVLCLDCFRTHQVQFTGHNVLHAHPSTVCCMHQKPTKKHCIQCQIYNCLKCLGERCENHTMHEYNSAIMNSQIEELKSKAELRRKTDEENIEHLKKLDANAEVLFKKVKDSTEEFKEDVDKWKKANLDLLRRAREQMSKDERDADVNALIAHINKSSGVPQNMDPATLFHDVSSKN